MITPSTFILSTTITAKRLISPPVGGSDKDLETKNTKCEKTSSSSLHEFWKENVYFEGILKSSRPIQKGMALFYSVYQRVQETWKIYKYLN